MHKLIVIFFLLFSIPQASAQDFIGVRPNIEQSAKNNTHAPLNLTPDKSELLRLDRDAISVVIGNPAHINVLLDTPRVVVVVPRQPGATHFTILDQNGDVIMQRHAIVAPPSEDYVRVRRSCANAAEGENCHDTSVYYCPDTCHEIQVMQPEGESSSPSTADIPAATPAGPTPTGGAEE